MSWLMRLMGTTNNGEVDSNGQQRVIHYDASGNSLNPVNRATVSETVGGSLMSAKDYKIARTVRATPNGSLAVADDNLIFADQFEGTTRSPLLWSETLATMTVAQTLATGMQLNSGGSTTTAQGALEASHRTFPLVGRSGLVFRARMRVVGATNCFAEWGFSDCSSATTALINNGAFFRRDGSGSLQPILAFNGVEGAGPTMTGPLTTEYAIYNIFLEEDRARFEITDANGVLVSSQVMERGATGVTATGVKTQARMFAATHLPIFFRVYNSGTAGTAPQINVTQVVVFNTDYVTNRPWNHVMSGMGYNCLASPTTYAQLANNTNSGALTTRTLSNTAAAETTLGGNLRVNSIAGGNTDYIMFGWQNPSPYVFYVDSISIPVPLNEVVAVATTATLFSYFAQWNTSAVSLATGGTYPGFRLSLPGVHTAAVGVAANTLFSGTTVQITFPTPLAVMPGRFFHIGCREWVGTATATETYLWAGVGVTGYFD